MQDRYHAFSLAKMQMIPPHTEQFCH